MCSETASTTSGLSNNGISRRRFIQGGIITGFGFMLGMARPVRSNASSPSSSNTLDWTLKQINGVHYLRVQADTLADRIEWHHSVSGITDVAQLRTDPDQLRQAEFLLGNLTGRIELKIYRARQLIQTEQLQIEPANETNEK